MARRPGSRRTPFEVLGVNAEAERSAIRAAYRARAKLCHPDTQVGMTPDEASRRMAELNWAWDELQRDLGGWRMRVAAREDLADVRRPDHPRGKPSFSQIAHCVAYTFGALSCLGLLAVPPVVLLDFVSGGQDQRGGFWRWDIASLAVLVIGIAIELAIALTAWRRVKQAWRRRH